MIDAIDLIIVLSVIFGLLLSAGAGFCIAVSIIYNLSDVGKEYAPFEVFSQNNINILYKKTTNNLVQLDKMLKNGEQKVKQRWFPK